MPEPTGANGDVAFGRQPLRSVAGAGGRLPGADVAGRRGAAVFADRVVCHPAGVSGGAALVADPTDVGADIAEDHGAGLEFADQLPGAGPIVVGILIDGALLARSAIVTVAAVGA